MPVISARSYGGETSTLSATDNVQPTESAQRVEQRDADHPGQRGGGERTFAREILGGAEQLLALAGNLIRQSFPLQRGIASRVADRFLDLALQIASRAFGPVVGHHIAPIMVRMRNARGRR